MIYGVIVYTTKVWIKPSVQIPINLYIGPCHNRILLSAAHVHKSTYIGETHGWSNLIQLLADSIKRLTLYKSKDMRTLDRVRFTIGMIYFIHVNTCCPTIQTNVFNNEVWSSIIIKTSRILISSYLWVGVVTISIIKPIYMYVQHVYIFIVFLYTCFLHIIWWIIYLDINAGSLMIHINTPLMIY